MKISGYVITMLLIAGVITGVYSFANTLGERHGVTPNTDYEDTFAKIGELENITLEVQDNIRNISAKEDKSFFTGTWDAIKIGKEATFGGGKITIKSLDIGTSLITNFLQEMSMGDGDFKIGAVLIGVLTILLLSAVIFLIVKRVW